MREGDSISATAPGHEHELAASAQTVDGEKHLIPRKVGALTRDLFQVAEFGAAQHVDYLILHDRMLRHVPPFEERNVLLERKSCIVGATGWCRRIVEGDVRQQRGLQVYSMKERATPIGRLRSFGSVTSRGTAAKYLSEGREGVSRESSLRAQHGWDEEGTTLAWLPVEGGDRE